jgi:hypothetical protein
MVSTVIVPGLDLTDVSCLGGGDARQQGTIELPQLRHTQHNMAAGCYCCTAVLLHGGCLKSYRTLCADRQLDVLTPK